MVAVPLALSPLRLFVIVGLNEHLADVLSLVETGQRVRNVVERVNGVDDRLDGTLLVQLEDLGEYLENVAPRVVHLSGEEKVV